MDGLSASCRASACCANRSHANATWHDGFVFARRLALSLTNRNPRRIADTLLR
jgi:hypothetical protein